MMRSFSDLKRCALLLGLALLAVSCLPAQAIIGTAGDGDLAVVLPTPGAGLPTPAQVTVGGMPPGASPHGVAYFGSDSSLVSDFGNWRVMVVQVSTAAVTAVIDTSASYGGYGSIAVTPNLSTALATGNSTTLSVIHAPFNAGSGITTIALPNSIAAYQTQAIVFNSAGRAFVYHKSGISVVDPPYTGIAFTIPVSGNGSSGAIAISPDGNTLLTTRLDNTVQIWSAPFTAASTPSTLTTGASSFDGLMVTPDGTKVLVCHVFVAGVSVVSAPFTPSSAVEQIPLPPVFEGATGFEDVGISADGQTAIFTGNSNSPARLPAAFVTAPFTAAGATVYAVTINGPGRGAGAVRFLPPGLAPGLTVAKSAPATADTRTNLTYTITYGNTGGLAATSVQIRETVPAGTSFVSATNGGTHSAGVVTWNIGTLGAGVTGRTVQFTAAVTADPGSTISNDTFSILADGVPPIPGPPVTTAVTGSLCVEPVVTADPASTIICPGTATTLTVAATGTAPLTYEWFQGATPAPGGTSSPNYTTPALAESASYWVRVTNACGFDDSAAATVSVVQSPTILVQPVGSTVCTGGSATLTVTARAPVVGYRWYQGANGDTSTPVGAGSRILVTGPLAYTATYWVRVMGECGTYTDSAPADVTVYYKPHWDINPEAAKVRTGGTATLYAEAEGGGIAYQWYQGEPGDISKPVEGATGESVTTPPLFAPAKFWARATNICGSTDSAAAVVLVENTWIIPHSAETPDWDTEVRAANVGGYAAPVRFDAYGADGALLETKTAEGPPVKGLKSWKPSDLFGAATLAKDHWLKATTSADIRLLATFATADGRGRASVPASASGSNGLVYPYVVTAIGGWYSGVTAVNDGAAAASARVEGFDAAGAKAGETTVTIPAKGKSSWLLDQIFGEGVDPSVIRSLRVTSDQPLVGLEVFGNWTWKGTAGTLASAWMVDAAGELAGPLDMGEPGESTDGVEGFPETALLFPENQTGGGRLTGLSVTNTGENGMSANPRAYDETGKEVGMKDPPFGFVLAPWAQQTREASQWFSDASDAAYFRVSSYAPLEGFQMVYNDPGQPEMVFAGLPGLRSMGRAFALPDVRGGADRKTLIRLTNYPAPLSPFPPPGPVAVSVTAYDESGNSLATAVFALANGGQETVELDALLGAEAADAAWVLADGDGQFLAHVVVEDSAGKWLTMYAGIPIQDPTIP